MIPSHRRGEKAVGVPRTANHIAELWSQAEARRQAAMLKSGQAKQLELDAQILRTEAAQLEAEAAREAAKHARTLEFWASGGCILVSSKLPSHLLAKILLEVPSDNLLVKVSVCARVCTDFWRAVSSSPAYNGSLHALDSSSGKREPSAALSHLNKQGRVLAKVHEIIRNAKTSGHKQFRELYHLGGIPTDRISRRCVRLHDGGAKALVSAVTALPAPLEVSTLWFTDNRFTADGIQTVVAALDSGKIVPYTARGDGLAATNEFSIGMGENPLGNTGIKALASVLPTTLTFLAVQHTDFGTDGLLALCKALPSCTNLGQLAMGGNRGFDVTGWTALGAALAQLTNLTEFTCDEMHVGDEGVSELVSPGTEEQPSKLEHIRLGGGIGDVGFAALVDALPRMPSLAEVVIDDHVATAAATAQLSQAMDARGIDVVLTVAMR